MSAPHISGPYKNDENLRIRIETHERYTVGTPLAPEIDRVLNLKGEESLLDLGTGSGDFPRRIRSAGHRGRIVGIDVSSGTIAGAKSVAADVEFFQSDAQALPFPDHSFDVVIAQHMLFQVPNIPRALREARRVLRVGGRFLAITNAHDNFAEYRQALVEAAERLHPPIADAMRVAIPATDVFNEQNGPVMIKKVFGNVSTTLVDAALRFETPEPALRYFDSCRSMQNLSDQQWAIIRQEFARVIAGRFSNGPWLISKTVVLLMAEVAR